MAPAAGDRELWQAKVDQLNRFAALTAQMDATQGLDGLHRLLKERQAVVAAVDRLDIELAGAQPPEDLRQTIEHVLTVVQARDGVLRRRLNQALRERAERLMAAAAVAGSPTAVPPPRFIDQQA